ncbi:hypothetical protein N9L68_07690 [bacterium]|nr:hypothetical protein [bacterium]
MSVQEAQSDPAPDLRGNGKDKLVSTRPPAGGAQKASPTRGSLPLLSGHTPTPSKQERETGAQASTARPPAGPWSKGAT